MKFKEMFERVTASAPTPSPKSSAAEAEDIKAILERRMIEAHARASQKISETIFAAHSLTKSAPPDPLQEPINPAIGEAIMLIARRCAAELGGTEEKWRKSICDRANDRPRGREGTFGVDAQFKVKRKIFTGRINGWTA